MPKINYDVSTFCHGGTGGHFDVTATVVDGPFAGVSATETFHFSDTDVISEDSVEAALQTLIRLDFVAEAGKTREAKRNVFDAKQMDTTPVKR